MIHKRFDLRDVRECLAVTNPFWYGWRIRWTPHGWLYNVSGGRAVDLSMRNGKHYRIGTDAPEDLVKAVQRVIASRSPTPNVMQAHSL